jgi:hypothetical protein
LDALHVATALRFAGDIGAVFTYDVRMQDALAATDLAWATPGTA